jgi:hypothetical protein
MKLCVCVRSFLENPYLDFFIEYYVLLGFDKILILKSDTEPYSCNPKYEKYVNIINVNNSGNRILQENIHYIQNTGCDWTFFPDVDEVLILHKQYKNIREFTERKVREYPDINMFYFRWGVIEKYDIEANNSFNDIVNDYNIFACRFIKSMVRTPLIKLLHEVFNILHREPCLGNTCFDVEVSLCMSYHTAFGDYETFFIAHWGYC